MEYGKLSISQGGNIQGLWLYNVPEGHVCTWIVVAGLLLVQMGRKTGGQERELCDEPCKPCLQ